MIDQHIFKISFPFLKTRAPNFCSVSLCMGCIVPGACSTPLTGLLKIAPGDDIKKAEELQPLDMANFFAPAINRGPLLHCKRNRPCFYIYTGCKCVCS